MSRRSPVDLDKYLKEYQQLQAAETDSDNRCLRIMTEYFPGKKFTVIGRGSSATVFQAEGEPRKVYKLYRADGGHPDQSLEDYQDLIHTYSKNEFRVANLLHKNGRWAPKVDRRKSKLNVPYPVIVMEYIEPTDVAVAPRELREKTLEELTELLLKLQLMIGDVEPVYIESQNKIRFIDVGGFSDISEELLKQGKGAVRQKIVHRLAHLFNLHRK